MPKAVVKVVGKLSKSFGQVLGLPTVSTTYQLGGLSPQFLPSFQHTFNTQFSGGFAQTILADLYLLVSSLCPVSTRPINNTNLIKEL